MVGIYKITNIITNQCYIGQSINIENRWRQHIYEGQKLRRKNKFYLALNQYGIEAFEFEVLEECPLEQKILDERECYWIEYYDSYNNGYNSTLGGQSEISWKYDPQVMRDLWDEGYSFGEILKIVGCAASLLQKRLQGYGDYNAHTSHSRGITRSVLERKNKSRLTKGIYHFSANSASFTPVTVYQYDLNGQYVTEHESMTGAARKLGHSNPGAESAIRAVLNHERQTAYGYQWSREKVESMPIVPVSHGKLVRCVNTNQIFHSTREAAAWCNLRSHSGVRECCVGQRKTAGKHPETGERLKWEYIEN